MYAFEVKDMTCGHCVSTITKAVKAKDPGAKVQIDLANHRVEIDAGGIDSERWGDVIKDAGYTPVAIEAGTQAAMAVTKPARSGCCCG